MGRKNQIPHDRVHQQPWISIGTLMIGRGGGLCDRTPASSPITALPSTFPVAPAGTPFIIPVATGTWAMSKLRYDNQLPSSTTEAASWAKFRFHDKPGTLPTLQPLFHAARKLGIVRWWLINNTQESICGTGVPRWKDFSRRKSYVQAVNVKCFVPLTGLNR